MIASRQRGRWPGLLAAALLAACASGPAPEPAASLPLTVPRVDEAAMLPLLGHLQLLQQMSPQELQRERSVLAAIPQTPATQVRLAMVLGQVRGPSDLVRALGLLDAVLKSSEPAAASLHPLTRALASQYRERLRLETQNEKLLQQLKDSQRRSSELQAKLDALTDIERSLPERPTAGSNAPGAP
ncbi:MAG: hypothetical protein MUE59_09915 [Thiobacillaceae bacterium]|jgi:hypothetical protein|nr:hypothetical protein [Thiobacillaceae bacterium]